MLDASLVAKSDKTLIYELWAMLQPTPNILVIILSPNL